MRIIHSAFSEHHPSLCSPTLRVDWEGRIHSPECNWDSGCRSGFGVEAQVRISYMSIFSSSHLVSLADQRPWRLHNMVPDRTSRTSLTSDLFPGPKSCPYPKSLCLLWCLWQNRLLSSVWLIASDICTWSCLFALLYEEILVLFFWPFSLSFPHLDSVVRTNVHDSYPRTQCLQR